MAVLQGLWGPDIRFDTAKLNMKCAGFGAPVEWHQDWAFYPHTNDNLAAVGVMFDDMAMENGPLMVIPGSHKGPIFDHHADGVFCGAMNPANRDVDFGNAVALTGQGGLDHRASCPRGARIGAQCFRPRPAIAAVPVPSGGCLADPRLSRRDRGVRRTDGRRSVMPASAFAGASAAAASAGYPAGVAVRKSEGHEDALLRHGAGAMSQPPELEPIFDRTPHPFGGGPVDPVVYDASLAALRQRTVNFAARRYTDMMMVSGLDRDTADRHFRLRAATVPAGLDAPPGRPRHPGGGRRCFRRRHVRDQHRCRRQPRDGALGGSSRASRSRVPAMAAFCCVPASRPASTRNPLRGTCPTGRVLAARRCGRHAGASSACACPGAGCFFRRIAGRLRGAGRLARSACWRSVTARLVRPIGRHQAGR